MRKIFTLFAVSLLCNTAFADESSLKIGEKIYDRSFGRGCGSCHDISSNPQLVELIQAGELDIDSFANTLVNGKNGMPKAMAAIMAVRTVKRANYTEEQAINALYEYLDGDSQLEVVLEEEEAVFLSQEEKDNAIILNPDFSFNIPVIKQVDQNGVEHYYKVDFSFTPNGNRLFFEPSNITELQ